MSVWRIQGRVVTGLGQGAGFTGLPWARDQFIELLGIDPHPGTLNLELIGAAARAWQAAREDPGTRITPPDSGSCAARCFPARIGGRVHGAVVLPEIEGYPTDRVEVISAVHLRQHLRVADGDVVEFSAMERRGIRSVVFDVDGTLVNSIEGMSLAVSRAAAGFGLQVPQGAVRRALNSGESLWQLILPEDKRDDSGLPQALRAEAMKQWPSVLAESVTPFAGLEDTLHRLREVGLTLAIYTGSRGESFLPLQRAGLLELFDPILTAADVERPKPHPEGLLRCLERLGCEAAEAAYVGDTRHDIEAGKAAGMYAIGVLTGAASSAILAAAGADAVVAGHRGLGELLVGMAPPALRRP